jgi:glycine cleavage system H protein
VNDRLADKPELVNEDPYGDGWLVKIRLADAGETGGLLERDAYVATLE